MGVPGRYQAHRSPELRVTKPWHRLSYIVEALPARLEALSRQLGVPSEGGRVLDYGCAELPYRRFFGPGVEFVGADLPGNPDAAVELKPDGSLPVDDGSFDAVMSTQVLEHVVSPELHLAECLRVLRPGGRLLLSTHGLMVYHPDPEDLWRWTGAGLQRAVTGAGFEIERFEGVMGIASVGLQFVQDSVYDHLPQPLRPLFSLAFQSLIRVVERVWPDRQRRLNACVFALVARKAPEYAGSRLLGALASARPDAFFVEIGSNDGEQHDHLRHVLRESAWRGLMVEPVPYVFERLRRNYGDDPRFALENAAVAESDGRLALYHLREAAEGEAVPPWYDAIGSFSRETVLGHRDKIPDIEERIVATEVTALSFEALLRKHSVETIDLLVVDTEGHDWEILRHVDLDSRRPAVLVYEHYHLPARVRREARAHLEAHGYETMEEGFDTWCLDPRAEAEVTAVWRGLEPAYPAFSADERPA